MKKNKDEHDPAVVTEKTDVDPSKNEGSRIASSIGTGAPPPVTPGEVLPTSPDPNIDIARGVARDTYARKEAAGERTGQLAEEPVSMANQPRGPMGPVPDGHRRMKATGNISMGGRTYMTGETLDVPDAEYESLKGSLEEI